MADQEHLKILEQGVEVWNEWRNHNPGIWPDLTGANLRGADLSMANLNAAVLAVADLSWANLRGASLVGANLSRAELVRADLRGTNLVIAILIGPDLTGADLSGAMVWATIFGDVNLSVASGLDAMKHIGPSIIGIDTLYRSRGNIPEVFLRGAGAPEELITYARSLMGKTTQFYSCFISHSCKDQEFAAQLHADLRANGVRCWFAPEDMKIGNRIRVQIDESIQVYDKLLLILSEHSIASQWVEQEVEDALEKERKTGKTVLFPIRLDDTVMQIETGWARLIRNTRHIGNFRQWKDHDAYQKALVRLLRDLKEET